MALQQITYQNKTNQNPIVNRSKQATAEDFNEIKSKFNAAVNKVNLLTSNAEKATYTSGSGYNRILTMTSHGLGSTLLLSVTGTRGSYVIAHTFFVSCVHPGRTDITQLTGSNYGTFHIRALGNSQGHTIIDIDFGGNTGINVTVVPLAGGSLTLNPSYVDGNSIPSGFTDYYSFDSVTRGIRTRRLLVDETIQCTTLTQTSDRKYKQNIEQIDGEWALDVFKKLKFSFYDFSLTKRNHAGLIAQEVERILPKAVHTNELGEKSLDYTYIDIVCKAAIQHFIKKQIQ